MNAKDELIKIAKEKGYLDYALVVDTLKEDLELMPEQIEDVIQLITELGIEVRNKE